MKDVMARWAQRRLAARHARERRVREAREQAEARQRFEDLHRLRLEKASGISALQVVCHEEIWRFIRKIAFPTVQHHIAHYGWVDRWADPEPFPEHRISRSGDGTVTVSLCGTHLARGLSALRAVLDLGGDSPYGDPEQYALAHGLYPVLSEAVDDFDPHPPVNGASPCLIIEITAFE